MRGNAVMWSLFMPEDRAVKTYCKEAFQLSKPYGKEHLYLISGWSHSGSRGLGQARRDLTELPCWLRAVLLSAAPGGSAW
jgi:hypothetical protein